MFLFKTLVLSGGFIKGLAILGSLHYFHSYYKDKINNISTFIGTSIGSIICYLLILGYTSVEILTIVTQEKLIEKLGCFNILSGVNGKGLISFNVVTELLRRVTYQKTLIQKDLTLLELKYIYNKTLICVTYNYSKRHIVYLSFDSFPNITCLEAIQMSSSLPIIFDEFIYNGDKYVDGGICNNFAINITNDEEETLGILVSDKLEEHLSVPESEKYNPSDNISLNSPHSELSSLLIEKELSDEVRPSEISLRSTPSEISLRSAPSEISLRSTPSEISLRSAPSEISDIITQISLQTKKKEDLIQYIYNLLMIPSDELTEKNIKSRKKNFLLIRIQVPNATVLSFDVKIRDQLNIFSLGYSLTKNIILEKKIDS